MRLLIVVLAVLVKLTPAPRITATGNQLILDGASSTPYELRAVYYSPTPWGLDDALYYQQQPMYDAEYASVFERDLDLISAMGANAVRLHGFMGVAEGGNTPDQRRHQAFLDAAAARNIGVLLTYELLGSGPNAKRLVTPTELAAAVADLRFFVRAARHPAVTMLVLGDSLNRIDAGYVCFDSGTAALGCQFSEDIDSFADGTYRLPSRILSSVSSPFFFVALRAALFSAQLSRPSARSPRQTATWPAPYQWPTYLYRRASRPAATVPTQAAALSIGSRRSLHACHPLIYSRRTSRHGMLPRANQAWKSIGRRYLP